MVAAVRNGFIDYESDLTFKCAEVYELIIICVFAFISYEKRRLITHLNPESLELARVISHFVIIYLELVQVGRRFRFVLIFKTRDFMNVW